MPFTKKVDRDKVHEYILGARRSELVDSFQPGDWCYFHYFQMVKHWKANRKWTTAHMIYKKMRSQIRSGDVIEEQAIAYELAWQVFFQLHVIPYEKEKRAENGDI